MSGSSQETQDHDTIIRWAEERGGAPAVVRDTGGDGKGVGVLRIDFDDGEPDDRLEPISWEEWFETFDEKELVFLY